MFGCILQFDNVFRHVALTRRERRKEKEGERGREGEEGVKERMREGDRKRNGNMGEKRSRNLISIKDKSIFVVGGRAN